MIPSLPSTLKASPIMPTPTAAKTMDADEFLKWTVLPSIQLAQQPMPPQPSLRRPTQDLWLAQVPVSSNSSIKLLMPPKEQEKKIKQEEEEGEVLNRLWVSQVCPKGKRVDEGWKCRRAWVEQQMGWKWTKRVQMRRMWKWSRMGQWEVDAGADVEERGE